MRVQMVEARRAAAAAVIRLLVAAPRCSCSALRCCSDCAGVCALCVVVVDELVRIGVFDVALRLALDAASRALAQVGDARDCDGRSDVSMLAYGVQGTDASVQTCVRLLDAVSAQLALLVCAAWPDAVCALDCLCASAWWRCASILNFFYDAPGSHT